MMRALLAVAGWLLGASVALAQMVLETPGYVITITSNCEEGVVVCHRATYHGVSKKSGRAITLQGETLHTTCADGETPCRFVGWRFRNGDVVYEVFQDGTLVVRKGARELLREQGKWQP